MANSQIVMEGVSQDRTLAAGAVPSRAAAPPAAPAAAAAPAAPAAKQELVHARRREDELSTRLAAMEAELGAARTSRTDLLEQLAELTQRLQVIYDRLKNHLLYPLVLVLIDYR